MSAADLASGVTAEEVPILGESDWDEQDLLTIEESSERLEAEMGLVRAEIERATEGDERDRLARRFQAMEHVLYLLRQGPTPLASTAPNH